MNKIVQFCSLQMLSAHLFADACHCDEIARKERLAVQQKGRRAEDVADVYGRLDSVFIENGLEPCEARLRNAVELVETSADGKTGDIDAVYRNTVEKLETAALENAGFRY